MTKRTAWLCSISLTLVIAGYVAWCGRSFYLKPRLDLSIVPQGAAGAMPRLREEAEMMGMTRPEKFDIRVLAEYLCKPHSRRHHRILVQGDRDSVIMYSTSRSGSPLVTLIRTKGQWVRQGQDRNWSDWLDNSYLPKRDPGAL